MTTSNDDQTTQLPEFDETTPLPTVPAPSVGQDATTEMPISSPDFSSDPLAIFREAPTTQIPADPFRADAGVESQAGASGAQGSQAQAGAPSGSVGTGGRTAFDPASTGESVPRGHEAGAAAGAQEPLGASAAGAHATWSAPTVPVDVRTMPEAPRRGVRVGSFVWALLVCMVGAFLIAEAYITNLNLPILGISAIAILGVILILTALFSGRSTKTPKQGAGTPATPNPANAFRRD